MRHTAPSPAPARGRGPSRGGPGCPPWGGARPAAARGGPGPPQKLQRPLLWASSQARQDGGSWGRATAPFSSRAKALPDLGLAVVLPGGAAPAGSRQVGGAEGPARETASPPACAGGTPAGAARPRGARSNLSPPSPRRPAHRRPVGLRTGPPATCVSAKPLSPAAGTPLRGSRHGHREA